MVAAGASAPAKTAPTEILLMRVHRESIHLIAAPTTVREFILTPERMMDYYPGGISCGVFEAGKAYFCHGKAGVSLVELVEERKEPALRVTLKVTTARGLRPPFSPDSIRDNAFFSMLEDWELHPDEGGTRLVKTWRDIEKFKMRWLPLNLIVRKTAKGESETLRTAWNRAALQ